MHILDFFVTFAAFQNPKRSNKEMKPGGNSVETETLDV